MDVSVVQESTHSFITSKLSISDNYKSVES